MQIMRVLIGLYLMFGSTRDQRSVIYLKVVPRLSETKAADPNLRVNSVNSSH